MQRSTLDTVSWQWNSQSPTGANCATVTTGKIMTMEELGNVQGRAWEDVDVGHRHRTQCLDKHTETSLSIENARSFGRQIHMLCKIHRQLQQRGTQSTTPQRTWGKGPKLWVLAETFVDLEMINDSTADQCLQPTSLQY